jgi:hypothetical protein
MLDSRGEERFLLRLLELGDVEDLVHSGLPLRRELGLEEHRRRDLGSAGLWANLPGSGGVVGGNSRRGGPLDPLLLLDSWNGSLAVAFGCSRNGTDGVLDPLGLLLPLDSWSGSVVVGRGCSRREDLFGSGRSSSELRFDSH